MSDVIVEVHVDAKAREALGFDADAFVAGETIDETQYDGAYLRLVA